MVRWEIGGARYSLDPAAISALRYRAEYGKSIAVHLAQCETAKEREGRLLRICHMMIPEAGRPELSVFAKEAHRDPEFVAKAERAVAALLDADPDAPKGEGQGEEFDEYELLAAMAVAGLGMELLYVLPVLHLAGVLARIGALRDPDRKTYHKMDPTEMAEIYGGPRQ